MITDLKYTVEFMNSEDYKKRFIAEYLQLKIRYIKLHKMIVKYEAGTLNFTPNCSLELLKHQKSLMGQYLYDMEVRAEIEKVLLPELEFCDFCGWNHSGETGE